MLIPICNQSLTVIARSLRRSNPIFAFWIASSGLKPLLAMTAKFNFDLIIFFALSVLYLKYIPNWTKEWFNFDSFYSFFPFLIIFVVQFFKTKAVELQKTEINPTNLGLLPLITGLLFYYTGNKADMDLLSGLSLPLLFSGILLLLYGKNLFMIVLPVIILLSLSIPVLPIFRLTTPLQIFLADISAKILNFLNIGAYSLGSNIFIDKYLVTVEAGCTGVKSLSSLLVINFLLFYFKNISVFKKFLIISFSLAISFIGNIIRILLIDFYIIYNGLKGSENFHYYIGLGIFALSLLIILVINEFIEDDKIAASQ
ncbi:MAG TPA: hypothetical protein DDW90_06095 [Cyanobacteria bacterium UBA9971]|nr:hypothetical protein [Cyanobacteria bacterium UBA9971]